MPISANDHNITSTGSTTSSNTNTTSLKSVLQKHEQDVETFVLTFPEEYCGSVATGCFRYDNDGVVNSQQDNHKTIIFCKDQDGEESNVQETMVHLGNRFGKVVAVCERVKRPRLDDLDPHSAGAKMWKLKEDQWRRKARRVQDDANDESDSDESDDSSSSSSSSSSLSSSSDKASAPSSKEFWLLEEAVVYYDPTIEIRSNNNNNNTKSLVDKSLQQKLRRAADRSISKSLDLVTLFMLTEFSQQKVQGVHPEWPDYVSAHRLPPSEQHAIMLTQEETVLLFEEKLVGAPLQLAMIFTILAGLPDNHCGNMAIQEVWLEDDDNHQHNNNNNKNNSWQLRIIHFDTGLLSTSVSLESLKLAYGKPSQDQVDYHHDFDFAGGRHAKAYYYPILFSSIFSKASQAPLHKEIQQYFLVPPNDLDSIFSTPSHTTGIDTPILKNRWKHMQHYVKNHPECSCQELAFDTILSWKRDYTLNETHEAFVEWLKEMKEWAYTNNC